MSDDFDIKDPLKPGSILGKYRIEKRLGIGGMAAVYLARHQMMDALFAIKVLFADVAQKDKDYIARFIREARLAGNIKHPNLVGVYDVAQDEATGLYYIVMEYVPGGNVSQRLKTRGAFPEQEAIRIVEQVAEALEKASEFQMVHRDIKPDNIMFGEKGEAKLSDLGIAKSVNEDETQLTMAHSVFGTPAYMSPEQAKDAGKVDVRADIYSLGVVFYEMLSGRRPYMGKTVMEVLSQIIADSPVPDVRTLQANVSRGTAELVQTMMSKDITLRPQNVTHLRTQLKAIKKASIHGQVNPDADVTMPTLPHAECDKTMPTLGSAKEASASNEQKNGTKSKRNRVFLLLAVGSVAVLAVAAFFLLDAQNKQPLSPPVTGSFIPSVAEILPEANQTNRENPLTVVTNSDTIADIARSNSFERIRTNTSSHVVASADLVLFQDNALKEACEVAYANVLETQLKMRQDVDLDICRRAPEEYASVTNLLAMGIGECGKLRFKDALVTFNTASQALVKAHAVARAKRAEQPPLNSSQAVSHQMEQSRRA